MSTQGKSLNRFPDKTYINGKWVDSVDSNTFEVLDPATNKLLGRVPDCTENDLELAISAANDAFKIWSSYTCDQRGKILRKIADLHYEYQHTLAEVITYENGKPLKESLTEVTLSARAFEWFGEEARRAYGDIIASPAHNKKILVIKEPIGVCGFICPWNFPSYMIARKASAALAAGCTVVIKPAEDTPYSSLLICQIAELAGLPAGCINIVTASRQSTPTIGKALCEHPIIRKISFTGSTGVGKIILSNCANHVKRTQMELGGNAPFIVFDSADLGKAISGLMASKFRNTGQTCVCANRILVQENIHDRFIEALAKAIKEQLIIGPGIDANSTQGPLINKNAIIKIERLIETTKSQGGKIVVGGKRSDLNGGNFFEPTLITNINENMDIAQEEIFGPVAAIIKFKTEEEALRIANSVSVGLAGYFFSSDLAQIWRVAEKLEVGMVGANEGILTTIESPFGGIKQSGFGYEGSKYGILEYLHNKYVCLGIDN